MGVGFGYSLVAYGSTRKGLTKLDLNSRCMERDLEANWEVLAEPIQTLLRRHGVAEPYELLRQLTRGRELNRQNLRDFIDDLELPEEALQSLLQLTPASYIGNAAEQARQI